MAVDPLHRKLRAIRMAAFAGIGLLLAAAGSVWLFGPPQAVQQAAAIGGPFTLENGAGQTVTNGTFRGKWLLVYFGYSYCPDVCPTTLNDVAQALDKLGKLAAKVQPVFITIDPERDTPAVVKQYAAAFSPDFIGLTGTPEQIASVAREYRVYYAKHRTGPAPGDYTMDHSSVLYLMAPDGRFAGIIRASDGPDAIATDLSRYLSP